MTNLAIIMGNITQDLELKKMPNGDSVLNFSVATNRKWTDKKTNQLVEEVEFSNIVVFGKQAETVSKFFNKGDKIMIQGRLKTESWDDKETGKKMYKTQIVLERFEFTQQKGVSNTSSEPYKSEESTKTKEPKKVIEYPTEDVNPEDITF